MEEEEEEECLEESRLRECLRYATRPRHLMCLTKKEREKSIEYFARGSVINI